MQILCRLLAQQKSAALSTRSILQKQGRRDQSISEETCVHHQGIYLQGFQGQGLNFFCELKELFKGKIPLFLCIVLVWYRFLFPVWQVEFRLCHFKAFHLASQ